MSGLSTARSVKGALQRIGLLGALRAVGLPQFARRVYDRAVIMRGRMRIRILGEPLRFVVGSRREVRRLENLSFEDEVIERIAGAVRPGDVFYDIGANIGVVSVAVGAHRRDAGITIHAFEPEPANAEHLRRNLALNGLGNARVHELALGSESGTIRLYVQGEVGEGTHSIVARDDEARDALEIPVRAGADFAAEHGGAPDIMKIDVEGAEVDVLHGFGPDFERGAIRSVFVEVHPALIAGRQESPETIRAWMEARGYRLEWSSQRWGEVHQQYERRDDADGADE